MRSVRGCLKSETSSARSWRSSPPVYSRSVHTLLSNSCFLFPPKAAHSRTHSGRAAANHSAALSSSRITSPHSFSVMVVIIRVLLCWSPQSGFQLVSSATSLFLLHLLTTESAFFSFFPRKPTKWSTKQTSSRPMQRNS